MKEKESEHEKLLKEKEYEIARLKALLNIDGTNHGIPTSMTPIHKKKIIPNTREKSNKVKGGQIGHKKHKLERFEDELDYKNEYFLWVYDFDIPFTNNLSERSLRGAKSKMKSAGQFWSEESAKWYATIKTYIETCNRNKVNIYIALLRLRIEKPYTLKQILENKVD